VFPAYLTTLQRYRVLYSLDEPRLRSVSKLAADESLRQQAHAIYLRKGFSPS
jgi:hypothetical protein